MLSVAALAWRDHLQSVRATVWEFIRYESTVIRQFTWQRVSVISHVTVFLTTSRGFLRRHDHKFTLMDELLRSFHQNVPSRVTICNFYAFLLSVQWEEITSASSPTSSLFNLSNNGFRLDLTQRVCNENCSTYLVLCPWSYVAHALRDGCVSFRKIFKKCVKWFTQSVHRLKFVLFIKVGNFDVTHLDTSRT